MDPTGDPWLAVSLLLKLLDPIVEEEEDRGKSYEHEDTGCRVGNPAGTFRDALHSIVPAPVAREDQRYEADRPRDYHDCHRQVARQAEPDGPLVRSYFLTPSRFGFNSPAALLRVQLEINS